MTEIIPAHPNQGGKHIISKAILADEQQYCYALALKSFPLRKIAAMATRHFGYNMSHETVRQRINSEIEEVVGPAREAYRNLELAKLEQRESRLLAIFNSEHVLMHGGEMVRDDITGDALIDDAPVLAANRAILQVQERRAKLLGLDAPTQIQADTRVRYVIEGVDMDELT